MLMNRKKRFNFKLYLNTRRELVYAVSLVVLSVFFGVGVFLPQLSKLVKLRSDFLKERQKTELLREKAENLDSLRIGVDIKRLKILDQLLPNEKPFLEVMNQLTNISRLSRVQIDDLKVSPGIISQEDNVSLKSNKLRSRGYESLRLELVVSGPFRSVKRFMNLLEKMAPFTTINSFTLSQSNQSSDEDLVSARLEIDSYFYTRASLKPQQLVLTKLSQADLDLIKELSEFKQLNVTFGEVIKDGFNQDLFGVEGWRNN